MPRTKQNGKSEEQCSKNNDPGSLPAPALEDVALRMSYRIARGEQGVLTFEPYKSLLLPFWRFRTAPIATESSKQLWMAFTHYVDSCDLVGADMARKFIQMGMTRAKRYANHAGGKKYDRSAKMVERDGGTRVELAKSTGHKGMEEKLQASEIFREVWKRATSYEQYLELKKEFLKEQKAWDKEHGGPEKDKFTGQETKKEIKTEVKEEDEDD